MKPWEFLSNEPSKMFSDAVALDMDRNNVGATRPRVRATRASMERAVRRGRVKIVRVQAEQGPHANSARYEGQGKQCGPKQGGASNVRATQGDADEAGTHRVSVQKSRTNEKALPVSVKDEFAVPNQ